MKKYLKGITQDDYGSKSPAAATSLSNQQRLSSEIITRAWLWMNDQERQLTWNESGIPGVVTSILLRWESSSPSEKGS